MKHGLYIQAPLALLFYDGAWFFLTLTPKDNDFKVRTVCFLNETQAKNTQERSFQSASLMDINDWPPLLLKEIMTKVFKDPDQYEVLFQMNEVELVRGFTTDTLEIMQAPIEAKMEYVRQMQANGNGGSFLSFPDLD